jgi:hypothetical protein
MKIRSYLVFPFLVVLFMPATVKAQAKAVPPTFVMRFNSLDSLAENAKFLAGLSGQKDAVRQIEGALKTKGMEGVDGQRPLGAYGMMGKELGDISGAVLIPVSDEKAFLEIIKGANLETIKGADGIYTVKAPLGIDAYLRFANKYAYITALKQTALEDKNLLDPAKVLAGQPTAAFSLTIQLNQVSDTAKYLAASMADSVMQEVEKKDVPGETKAQRAFRAAALKECSKIITAVFKDGGELKVAVDINKYSGDLAASFSLAGVAGSEMAASIDALSRSPSMFGGLLKKDVVSSGLGRLKLSDPLVKALGDLFEEFRGKALANISDAAVKQQANAFFSALAPTLQTGDFDGAFVVTENAKILTAVTAVKVKDGVAVEKSVRDLVNASAKNLPPNVKDKIKLDMDAVGGVKIHKVELGGIDPNLKMLEQYLGEANLYLAFRKDAMFISLGKEGLQAIKAAIPLNPLASTPLAVYEFDVARLVNLTMPDQITLSKKYFPTGQGGTVRITVEGGSAITARLTTKVSVLSFFGAVGEMQKK